MFRVLGILKIGDVWSQGAEPSKDSQQDVPEKRPSTVITYRILSHYWEKEEETRTIRAKRDGEAYDFFVSPLLEQALKALRHKVEDGYLWIDAICIDQGNLRERNSQVSKIDRIYGGAPNVCVWIVPIDDKSNALQRFRYNNEPGASPGIDNLCIDQSNLVERSQQVQITQKIWVEEVALASRGVEESFTDFSRSRLVIAFDFGCTSTGVAYSLSSENHQLMEMQYNRNQTVNRERLEDSSGVLKYHLTDRPGFDDTHRTTDLKFGQELLRRLPQVHGQMVPKRLHYGLELTSNIPRSLNARSLVETLLNAFSKLGKALERIHRLGDKGDLEKGHREWHQDIKPQSIFRRLPSINVDGVERLCCQCSDKPMRSAINPLEQCAQYSWANTNCFFGNPAAALPGSDYALGGRVIISHVRCVGGTGERQLVLRASASETWSAIRGSEFWARVGDKDKATAPYDDSLEKPGPLGTKTTVGRYIIESFQWDERRDNCFRVNTEDRIIRFGISYLKQMLGSVPFHVWPPGGSDFGSPAVEERDLSLTGGSDRNRGDQGVGPQAGKPNLGREDDDDDDCVGFRRVLGFKYRRGNIQGDGRSFRGRADMQKCRAGDVHPSQARYGRPYHGLVDTILGRVVVHSPSASTVSMWREAIARTCMERKVSDPSSMAWESAGKEANADGSIYMGTRGGGNSILCAH